MHRGALLFSGTTRDLLGAVFPAHDTGWIVGTGGTIMKTSDGTSWSLQSSGVTSTLQGVDFVDTATGFAVGANGVIQATVNGGSTWTTQTSNVPTATTTLYGVSALDTQTAYRMGNIGTNRQDNRRGFDLDHSDGIGLDVVRRFLCRLSDRMGCRRRRRVVQDRGRRGSPGRHKRPASR